MGRWIVGVCAAAVVMTGCRLPLPYSPEQLATDALRRPAKALVHYLGQAPPLAYSVCDPHATGPRVVYLDDDVVDALQQALIEGEIPPENWEGCLRAMWAGAQAPVRKAVAFSAVDTFLLALDPGGDWADTATMEAAVRVIASRPDGARLPAERSSDAVSVVRADLATRGPEIGAVSHRFLEEVEIDLGMWDGVPLDAGRISSIDDQGLLLRFADRVPDEALKRAAIERTVRLRVAASPWKVVHSRTPEVIDATLAHGHWAVPTDRFPVRSLVLSPTEGAGVAVHVAQDPRGEAAALHAATADGEDLGGRLPLRDLLLAHVDGIERPIRVCNPEILWDPSPCLAVDALSMPAGPGRLDDDAVVQLDQALDPNQVAAWAREYAVTATVQAGEARLELALPTWFRTPEALVYRGAAGERGPDLVLRVRQEDTGRFVFEVSVGAETHVAVVEEEALGRFIVISAGGDGAPGEEGAKGRRGGAGAQGQDARCPDMEGSNGLIGHDGGPGEAGRPGGDGGPGGDVSVFVKCRGDGCEQLTARIAATVASRGGHGGPGGKGGAGGPGGPGGRGGQPASCHVASGSRWVRGGRDGADGIRGPHGAGGAAGTDGGSGVIEVMAVP